MTAAVGSRAAYRLPSGLSRPMEHTMFNFLLGVAAGLAAAALLESKRRSGRSYASAAAYGRVDELSSAAHNLPADPGMLNAGDGTPSGRSTRDAGGSPSSLRDPSADARHDPAQTVSRA